MSSFNELRSRVRGAARPRAGRGRIGARPASLALTLALSACGPDRATVEEDVRLEVSHEPPAGLVAGDSIRLDLRVSASPPLPAGAAHVWYSADGDPARVVLTPLAGTDRLRAILPPPGRGTVLRYRFTVASPLGDEVRLPAGPPAPAGEPGETPPVAGAAPRGPAALPHYELVARAPIEPWAAWLRGGGAALGTFLVLAGALLALRDSAAGRGRGARGWLRAAAVGVVLFAAAVLVGATAASWQATGDLLRDVPLAWWVALLLWLPVVVLAWRVRPPHALPAPGEEPPQGPPGRRTATAAATLAAAGALAALLGLGSLV
ncbi:MAG TPA: hypothetical protein VIC56_06560 [Gemmatimonadota bacterium]|jgi:hypothetical protein